MSTTIPLRLLRENGKRITLSSTPGHDSVGLIVWGKKDTPLLPLDLSVSEARGLRLLLDRAITNSVADSAEPNLAGALSSILRIAESDGRGWSDWNHIAQICRVALASLTNGTHAQ